MVKRLYSAAKCRSVTDKYPDYFTFDSDKWFSNPANHAYCEGENVGFAEPKSGGSYWVHFCFNTARGRQAIGLTRTMLKTLYDDTQFKSVVGLVHEDNRKARWLIRQVGFKSLGLTETPNGTCEMFYFTRKDLNGI